MKFIHMKDNKNKKIIWISLIIVLVILILDIIFSNLLPKSLPIVNQYFAKFHNNYLKWFITNIFWAIFVLKVIDKYIEQVNEKKEKEEQKIYIKRNIVLLKIYYKHFKNYLLHMVNPEWSELKKFTKFKQWN